MSSINIDATGVSGFFRSISATGALVPASSAVPSSATVVSDQQNVQAPREHHHGGGHGELFQKIQTAVTSALEAAKQDPSADPNKTVEDAIAKVFQDSGTAASASGSNAKVSVNDPDGDGDVDAAGKPDADASGSAGAPGSARSAFLQTLQQFGINPQQFHQDFLAAIQDARNGGSDSAALAFQSLPPGSTVDTTA